MNSPELLGDIIELRVGMPVLYVSMYVCTYLRRDGCSAARHRMLMCKTSGLLAYDLESNRKTASVSSRSVLGPSSARTLIPFRSETPSRAFRECLYAVPIAGVGVAERRGGSDA